MCLGLAASQVQRTMSEELVVERLYDTHGDSLSKPAIAVLSVIVIAGG